MSAMLRSEPALQCFFIHHHAGEVMVTYEVTHEGEGVAGGGCG